MIYLLLENTLIIKKELMHRSLQIRKEAIQIKLMNDYARVWGL